MAALWGDDYVFYKPYFFFGTEKNSKKNVFGYTINIFIILIVK